MLHSCNNVASCISYYTSSYRFIADEILNFADSPSIQIVSFNLLIWFSRDIQAGVRRQSHPKWSCRKSSAHVHKKHFFYSI